MRSIALIVFFLTGIAEAQVQRFLIGNPEDVQPKLSGPAFHLQGGGADVDAAFQWMVNQVRGCEDCATELDVVVIRASGDDDYNEYFFAMKGVDSVETLIITAPEGSRRPEIEKAVRDAEIIFFAGGDQCNYVRNIKGTPVHEAVESVYNRGGGISGTSAGLAIQGQFSYDACTGSTRSYEALGDPYHESITFTDDFFHWKYLQKTFTDTHLVERDRIGRTLAFLARQIQDGKTENVLGIAVDRETSLVLDRNGKAKVLGKGPVYFILADHKPERCEPGKPLEFSNYKIWKVDPEEGFDLKDRPTKGYYLRSVQNGVIDADPYAEKPCGEIAYKGKDAGKLKAAIDASILACPYDFSPYRYVNATGDLEFIRMKSADLRRLLNYITEPDKIQFYDTLWSMESKGTAPEELQKQIREDLNELSNDKVLSGLPVLEALRIGYSRLQDSVQLKNVEEQILAKYPESPAALQIQKQRATR